MVQKICADVPAIGTYLATGLVQARHGKRNAMPTFSASVAGMLPELRAQQTEVVFPPAQEGMKT